MNNVGVQQKYHIQQEIEMIIAFLNRPLKIEMETTPINKVQVINKMEYMREVIKSFTGDLDSCRAFLKTKKVPEKSNEGKPLTLQERLELLVTPGKKS